MSDAGGESAAPSLTSYLEILSRRRWVFAGVWGGCVLAAGLYGSLTRPVYEGDTLVELEKPSSGGLMQQGGVVIEGDDDEYFLTEYRRFKTDTLTQKVYDDLHLETVDDFAEPHGLIKLQKAIAIVPVPRTHLAYVKVRSHDPRLAALVSDTLAASYVQDHINNTLFMSRDVLKALQLVENGGGGRRAYDSLPSVVDNRLIQSTKEQKIALEGQIADMLMRMTPNHPQVIEAKGRLRALNKILDRETDNIVKSVKTQLSGELVANNVRVLDKARQPDVPVSPKKILALAFGLLAGAALGFMAAAAAESLDQSVRTEEDVERKVRHSFLGTVPYSRQTPGVKAHEALLSKDPTLTSEAFRNLRTMIDFAGTDGRATPLLVTSSFKEEGKSYVAANLAVAFSALGERVLLVDGDLRRPSVHKKFALSSERGLADFLAGGALVDDVAGLVQLAGVQNLDVLVCGPRPPNPSELLNTPRLAALVAWAAPRYDRVVVDCTPMYPISDTLLWGRHVRSAVFVSRFGRTRAPLVRGACERLKTGGVKVLGVAINAARGGGLTYAGGYDDRYYRDYAEPASPSTKES